MKENINIKMSFPKFVVGNLPLSMALLKEEKQHRFNGKAEDPRQKLSGMTDLMHNGNHSGFTLIELLVVVLIIGILAAVALPQYQKAVEKSKAAQALTMLKAVAQAQRAHYLATGTWAKSFDELAVDIPWTGHSRWADPVYVDDVRSNKDWTVELYRDSGNQFGVAVGRLTGKYKGAGFVIYTSASAAHMKSVWCAERIRDGAVNFQGTQGEYCRKLFKAKLERAGSFQQFAMP